MLEFQSYLNNFSGWLYTASALVLIGIFIAGLILNYFGFQLHQIVVFLGGALFLAVITFTLLKGFNASGIAVFLGTVVAFFIGGACALAMQTAAVFAAGALVGTIATAAMGANEAWAVVLSALIAGFIALSLYQFAIVIGSSFAGSLMMTKSSLALASVHTGLAAPVTEPGYWANIGIGTLLVFSLFFITGLLFQLNIHKVFPSLAHSMPSWSGRAKKPQSKPMIATPYSDRQVVRMHVSVYQNEQLLKTHPLDNERIYYIGRAPSNRIVVDDPGVSRHHLTVIARDGHEAVYSDRNSSTGTWKQGVEQTTKGVARDNDWLVIGNTQLLFHSEPENSF